MRTTYSSLVLSFFWSTTLGAVVPLQLVSRNPLPFSDIAALEVRTGQTYDRNVPGPFIGKKLWATIEDEQSDRASEGPSTTTPSKRKAVDDGTATIKKAKTTETQGSLTHSRLGKLIVQRYDPSKTTILMNTVAEDEMVLVAELTRTPKPGSKYKWASLEDVINFFIDPKCYLSSLKGKGWGFQGNRIKNLDLKHTLSENNFKDFWVNREHYRDLENALDLPTPELMEGIPYELPGYTNDLQGLIFPVFGYQTRSPLLLEITTPAADSSASSMQMKVDLFFICMSGPGGRNNKSWVNPLKGQNLVFQLFKPGNTVINPYLRKEVDDWRYFKIASQCVNTLTTTFEDLIHKNGGGDET